MDINLAAAPYYDDFDSTKNFYRILFKPGVPVQARELTQLQSILQDQIKKFANHVFVDGSRALKDNPVSVTINQNVKSVRLQPSATIVDSATYLNKYVTSGSSTLIGKVNFVYDADNPNLGDPQTLIINIVTPNDTINEFLPNDTLYFYDSHANAFTKGSTTISATTAADVTITAVATTESLSDEIVIVSKTGTIAVGDYVTGVTGIPPDLYVVKIVSDTRILLNKNFGVTDNTANLTFIRKNTSPSLILGISSGAYYKNGFFIQVPYQSIVVQKYTAFPNKSVILKYQESIVNYNDDTSLLDPAFGSSNYLGPGADRLKIELVIDSIDLDSNDKPNYVGNYIEIARFVKGKVDLIESSVDSTYSTLGSILAERTYAESGNYIVDPFSISPSGSTPDATRNKFYISKGRAFVGGYDITTIDRTELLVPKAKDYITTESVTVDTPSGPYILIDAPNFGIPAEQTLSQYNWFECHSTSDRGVMLGGNYGANSTLVGYIAFSGMQYDSGYRDSATFKFHWDFYTHWSQSKQPGDIRSIIGNRNWFSDPAGNKGSNTNPTFFANVSVTKGLEANGAGGQQLKIFDSTRVNRLVFPIESSYIKDVRRNNTTYTKTYSNVTISSGVATITTTSPNRFVGTVGELSSSIKRQYYISIIKQPTGIDGQYVYGYGNTDPWKIAANVFVPLESIVMTLDSTGTGITINFGNTNINSSMDVSATIYNDILPRKTKTLVSNYTRQSNIWTSDQSYSLFKSDVYSLKGVYKIGSNTFAGDYSSGTTYSINSMVQDSGLIYQAKATSTGAALTDSTKWTKISGESLLLYTLDNGQSDLFYNHGSIKFIGNQSKVPGKTVVVFDYFTHSGSGYFDAVSYPVNMYDRIPKFRSPKDTTEYNLRDCLDYRSRRQDDTGYFNPGVFESQQLSDIFLFDDWYKPVLDTATGTQIDIDFYTSRIDRLYVQNRDANTSVNSKFYLDKGLSAVSPRPNKDKTDKNLQLIATLVSPPYTASASDVKIIYNSSPRYTMKDISLIDNKLQELEKRVKKQGLEIYALNNAVFDRGGTSGNVLFKTGILVEDFSSLNVADITNPHHTVAIDIARNEGRPSFSADLHNLFFVADPDVSMKDNFVTMNYTEEAYVDVSSTTTSANTYFKVNPTSIVTDSGRVTTFNNISVASPASISFVGKKSADHGPGNGGNGSG